MHIRTPDPGDLLKCNSFYADASGVKFSRWSDQFFSRDMSQTVERCLIYRSVEESLKTVDSEADDF